MEMEKKAAEELLFGALTKLLHEKSLDKLSVTDIIKESGVCRATFYRYYSDKYDLFNSNYRKILEETLFRFNEGIPYVEVQHSLYMVLNKNIKLFQNAFRSSDANSLKNYIFKMSMDFFLGVLKKNGININDWKIKKRIEAFVYGNLEITAIWILEGAKEPVEDLSEVLNVGLPFEYRHFFIPEDNSD